MSQNVNIEEKLKTELDKLFYVLNIRPIKFEVVVVDGLVQLYFKTSSAEYFVSFSLMKDWAVRHVIKSYFRERKVYTLSKITNHIYLSIIKALYDARDIAIERFVLAIEKFWDIVFKQVDNSLSKRIQNGIIELRTYVYGSPLTEIIKDANHLGFREPNLFMEMITSSLGNLAYMACGLDRRWR